MKRCLLVLFGISSLSFSQIRAPQVGFARNPSGEIRPVSGLAASFVLGKPLPTHAISASFSQAAGVVLQPNAVVLLDVSGAPVASYPEGDAKGKTGITDGPDSAIAWLPATRTLVWFDGTKFQSQELTADLPGTVLGLRRDQTQALLLLNDEGSVSQASISLSTGDLLNVSVLADRAAPAAYLGTEVLSSEHIDIPCAATAIETMSAAWAHVSCAGGEQWAVHFVHGQAQASELPGSGAQAPISQLKVGVGR